MGTKANKSLAMSAAGAIPSAGSIADSIRMTIGRPTQGQIADWKFREDLEVSVEMRDPRRRFLSTQTMTQGKAWQYVTAMYSHAWFKKNPGHTIEIFKTRPRVRLWDWPSCAAEFFLGDEEEEA